MELLSPANFELYQRTDEILHYVWDPRGVRCEPHARDEYHAHLPHVFQLLKAQSSPSAIADYLDQVEADRMGLEYRAYSERQLRIATTLLAWKKRIDEKHQE